MNFVLTLTKIENNNNYSWLRTRSSSCMFGPPIILISFAYQLRAQGTTCRLGKKITYPTEHTLAKPLEGDDSGVDWSTQEHPWGTRSINGRGWPTEALGTHPWCINQALIKDTLSQDLNVNGYRPWIRHQANAAILSPIFTSLDIG